MMYDMNFPVAQIQIQGSTTILDKYKYHNLLVSWFCLAPTKQ